MGDQVTSGPRFTKTHLPAIDAALIEMFACPWARDGVNHEETVGWKSLAII